jgi:thiamine biosynthesis lipoprotein
MYVSVTVSLFYDEYIVVDDLLLGLKLTYSGKPSKIVQLISIFGYVVYILHFWPAKYGAMCMNGKWIVLIVAVSFILSGCRKKDYYTEQGLVFGSTYRIVYQSEKLMSDSIQSIFYQINHSLSTYSDSSVISRWNNNIVGAQSDRHMLAVYKCAKEVWQLSDGAFDLTVGPLVKAWGFWKTSGDTISPQLIDSLLTVVGLDKVSEVNALLVKSDARIRLDVNALAPGYCADLMGDMFRRQGINNFLIDIGGEIKTEGLNAHHAAWNVAIDKPVDDLAGTRHELEAIVHISGKSIATSGNYRHFYIKNGKKFAHTINPHTGYPAENSVLSASVITTDCMRADAIATAIMVLGEEKGFALANQLPDVEAYLVVSDSTGVNAVKYTQGFKNYLK